MHFGHSDWSGEHLGVTAQQFAGGQSPNAFRTSSATAHIIGCAATLGADDGALPGRAGPFGVEQHHRRVPRQAET
jgi:hypothetical protein